MISIVTPQSLGELKAWIESHAHLRPAHAFVEERFGKTVEGLDRGHDLAHFLRVAFWTLKIAADLPEKVDAVEAVTAALFHDIVAVPKNSPLRKEASRLCAEEAARVLPEMGFSKSSVENIAVAIRCHSFSRGEAASTPLAQALQDADRLEALGSIGIMRCISTGAQMGAEYFESDDPWAQRRELDDRAYSIDHFFTKLLKLHAAMNTAPGKREALRRSEVMRAFLNCLAEELAVPLPKTSLLNASAQEIGIRPDRAANDAF